MRFGIEVKDNPKTIQEKLIWLQFYDKANWLKPICADKLKVREYVKEKIGKDICVPLLKVYDSPKDFNINELPEKFVLKSNHASGQVIICRDKTNFDVKGAVSSMENWMSKPYGFQFFEPHYFYIDRKCFAEKLLERDDGLPMNQTDYKFFCFNGIPKLMHMVLDYHTPKQRMHYYDMNRKFRPDIDRNGFNIRKDLQEQDRLPENFDLMKEYATKLSGPFKFVRVDFYEVNGIAYLGEMTFTPGACRFSYKNPNTSIELGSMLKL